MAGMFSQLKEVEEQQNVAKATNATPTPPPTEHSSLQPNTLTEETSVPHTQKAVSPVKSPQRTKTSNTNVGHSRNKASTPASTLAISQDQLIETIRKTVKQVGKDVTFIRLTPDEKHELSSIVYSFNEMYRLEGRKTSENEIGRIAINYLLEDYRTNGEQSVLTRVIAALNA